MERNGYEYNKIKIIVLLGSYFIWGYKNKLLWKNVYRNLDSPPLKDDISNNLCRLSLDKKIVESTNYQTVQVVFGEEFSVGLPVLSKKYNFGLLL
jgi:hypothetical protein